MQTIKEEKKLFRQQCKQLRLAMPQDTRKQADRVIFQYAAELIEKLQPTVIYCYVSSPLLEVDTLSLIDYAFSRGTELVVPRCKPGTSELEHYVIKSLSQLEKGAFGIMEPIPSLCKEKSEPYSGLCIVPGLAFGYDGIRLGYGKGYYDRFLQKFQGVKVGLCYDCCCFPEGIPHETFDAGMDAVITEKGIR